MASKRPESRRPPPPVIPKRTYRTSSRNLTPPNATTAPPSSGAPQCAAAGPPTRGPPPPRAVSARVPPPMPVNRAPPPTTAYTPPARVQPPQVRSSLPPPTRVTPPEPPVAQTRTAGRPASTKPGGFFAPPPILVTPKGGHPGASEATSASAATAAAPRPVSVPPPHQRPAPPLQTTSPRFQVPPPNVKQASARSPPPAISRQHSASQNRPPPPRLAVVQKSLATRRSSSGRGNRPPPPPPPVRVNRAILESCDLAYLKPSLVKFYAKHNTDMVQRVDTILEGFSQFKEDEGIAQLNKALRTQYGEDLSSVKVQTPSAAAQPKQRPVAPSLHPEMRESLKQKLTADSIRAASGTPVLCKCLFALRSKKKDDLDFEEGDIIEVIDQKGSWWKGTLQRTGQVGKFPFNYVEVISGEASIPAPAELQHSESFMIKLGKKTNKLFQAVFELITSEFVYVVDLKLAKQVFIDPMTAKFGVQLSRSVFSVWTEMLVVHDQILQFMNKSVNDEDELIKLFHQIRDLVPDADLADITTQPPGKYRKLASSVGSVVGVTDLSKLALCLDYVQYNHECFISNYADVGDKLREEYLEGIGKMAISLCATMEKMSHFLKASTPYIANYHKALKFVEGLGTSDPEADKFVFMCEKQSNLNGLHLRDYLIKPVQRVCKYPLLIREIHRNALEEDLKNRIKATQDKLVEIASQVNTMIKDAERISSEQLQEYAAQLRPSDQVKKYIRLDQASFRMYRAGEIHCKVAPPAHKNLINASNLHAFLLSDHLLIAQKYTNILRRAKRYQIELGYALGNVKKAVRSDDPGNNCFTLNTAEGLWEFTVAGAGERDGWVADFAEALCLTQKARERHMTVQHQEVERERRKSLAVKRTQSMSSSQSSNPSVRRALSIGGQQQSAGIGQANEFKPVIAELKMLVEKSERGIQPIVPGV